MPRFHSDLHEGIRQTDEQLFGKERSRTAAQQKLVDQKLYNPLYWAMLLLSVPFFLLGRWVHLTLTLTLTLRAERSTRP